MDPHFERALASECAPAISYAVLHRGTVLHSRGIGTRSVVHGPPPDHHTGFRIASMTKSFTAATVLRLRDEGRLALDSPAVDWVPELAGGGPDARVITLRHLLTMGAGFATDDPWGDRQQDLGLEAFRALLERGIVPVCAPGDRFEYSNTGYAILGLVISAVTAQSYPDSVRGLLLDPLGLAETAFSVAELPGMAAGYVKRSDGWHEEPVAATGAFAPMGGLISTVADLASWVAFFQPGAGESVLSPLSVREMQRTQRLVAGVAGRQPEVAPTVTGYGFGLFEELGPSGRSVFHSGGYPGFGSHMRWHPASGLGVVALANGTYAPMSIVAAKALADLVEQTGAETVTPLPPVRGLEVAREAVRAWLNADEPDGPAAQTLRSLWADNVERDLPWSERLEARSALAAEFGRLHEVPGSRRRVEAGTETWTLAGDHQVTGDDGVGRVVRVVVMVAPHDTSLIQSVTLRPVSERSQPASVSLS